MKTLILILLAAVTAWGQSFPARTTQFLFLPDMRGDNAWYGGPNATLLNHADDRYALLFPSPWSVTATKVSVCLGTVTTGQTLRIGFQSISSSLPDGVFVESGTVSVADTDDNVCKEVTLDTPKALTMGTWYALVAQYDSTAATLEIRFGQSASTTIGVGGSGYFFQNTTGSYARTINGIAHFILLDASNNKYPTDLSYFSQSIATFGTTTQQDSDPDEVGNLIVSDYPLEVIGIHARMSNGVTTGVGYGDLVLYSGSTAIGTASVPSSATVATNCVVSSFFSAPVILAAKTPYRIVAKPLSDTVTFAVPYYASNVSSLPAHFGLSSIYRTYRTNAGSWTDDTATVAGIGLIVRRILVPAAAPPAITQ
jgi:hypothetical protein